MFLFMTFNLYKDNQKTNDDSLNIILYSASNNKLWVTHAASMSA
jgi:hypothetical protein